VQPPKYLHSKGFKRNLLLYGEHKLNEAIKTGYLVEGHFDVLNLRQFGYPNVVAPFGTGLGESQVERLVMFFDRIVTVGDGDKAGRGMNDQLERMIAGRVVVEKRLLPEGLDPGEFVSREHAADIIGPPAH
jgi:DNA primase